MSSRQEINSEYLESHTSSVVFMVACNASAANIDTLLAYLDTLFFPLSGTFFTDKFQDLYFSSVINGGSNSHSHRSSKSS